MATILLVSACRPAAPGFPPDAPDFQGRINGIYYDAASTGPGGLRRIAVAVDQKYSPALPPTGYAWIDSATRFGVVTESGIDWRMPRLRGAYVRVWLGRHMSNPTDIDFFGTARLIAIDSMPSPGPRTP